MQIETFTSHAIDGEKIHMHLKGDVIGFGTRFEESVRWNLHGLSGEYRQEKVRQAFDFFRNYASLFLRDEMAAVSKCYQRAVAITSTDTEDAFWHLWEGQRIVQIGKGVHNWVSLTPA